ncbi:high mobility group box domain-containing protein, partial [Spinellus fusiger]
LSAYMWYLTQVRPDTMKVYPGSTVGQISRLCADRWNTMTHEEQGPWKIKAQADKMRYAREMQVY